MSVGANEKLKAIIIESKQSNNYNSLIAYIPYARFLNISCEVLEEEEGEGVIFRLNKQIENIGNPTLPALHGGAIAGFMETAAVIHLLLMMDEPRIPKTIDFSIDYLRAGHYKDLFAECIIERQGRRVANVAINTWQETKNKLVSTARAHYLLPQA